MERWSFVSIFLLGCSQAAPLVAVDPALQDDGGVSEDPPQDGGPDASKPDGAKPPQDSGPDEQSPPGPAVVVTDIAISEIALFQGVKLPLMKDGAVAKSKYASAVAGRPGILRVYLKPSATFRPRELTAEVTLKSTTGTAVRQVKMNVTTTPSSESELGSTMNFTLAAEDLPQGSSSFKVRVLGSTYVGAPTTTPAEYPSGTTEASLDIAGSAKLRVVLVPVRYDADGSGRLPDTSTSTVEAYRKAFFETYPVSAVDVSVRAAMTWSGAIAANQAGWDDVLNQVIALRAQDKPSADTYYMGIFAPAATYNTYCASGCVAGLAPLITSTTDSSSRAGVAIGFSSDAWALSRSVNAAIHETGHMHGRSHVGNSGTNPRCGIPGSVDTAFPYSGDGSIGSWGYGLLDKQLYSPETYSDFMGYCLDKWVSDYTYGALLTRIAAVAPATKGIALPGGEYRFVQVSKDGNLRWGLTVDFPTAPSNNPTTVRVTDASGTIRNITGYYYPHGDAESGYILVRKSDAVGRRIEVDLSGTTRALAF